MKEVSPENCLCSIYRHCSDTALIKVYIPQTKATISVRRNDFRLYKGNELPGAEALSECIARQVGADRSEENELEAMLVKSFFSNY